MLWKENLTTPNLVGDFLRAATKILRLMLVKRSG
jgi:hypothetical protein